MTEEYAAAREGSAVVDVAGRGILAVTGPQRIKFLHNIVSNDLQSRGPGQGTLAAVMDVKGRLLVLMRALVTEDAVLLEMPVDRLDVIEPLLVHYKVAARCDSGGARWRSSPCSVRARAELLARAGGRRPRFAPPVRATSPPSSEALGPIVRASDFPPADGPSTPRPSRQRTTGHADRQQRRPDHRGHARRVARGGRPALARPRRDRGQPAARDGPGRRVPLPAKGCCVGQEVIARLEARGAHVNKGPAQVAAGGARRREARPCARRKESGW